jgi:hypothetical protein
MPNPHRGEIEALLDGTPFSLVLTLGALAELEHAFGDSDMLALAERFQSGRLSASDAVRIIGAGLRGAGHDLADDAVARMRAPGGAAGFVDIVARLLNATFGGAPPNPPAGFPSPLRGGARGGGDATTDEESTPDPFLGRR